MITDDLIGVAGSDADPANIVGCDLTRGGITLLPSDLLPLVETMVRRSVRPDPGSTLSMSHGGSWAKLSDMGDKSKDIRHSLAPKKRMGPGGVEPPISSL